jgi:hypothetical protein
MDLALVPLALAAPEVLHPARLHRQAFGALFQPAATVLTSRPGLLYGPTGHNGEFTLLNPTTLRVAQFVAVVQGTRTATQGTYLAVNDSAAADLTITAQHASQYRKALVVARVYDSEAAGVAHSATTDRGTLEMIDGALAASNPALPALPADAVAIGEVSIPPTGQSVTATHYGVTARAFLRGQPRVVADRAARLAIASGELYRGLIVAEEDSGRVWMRDGSAAWTLIGGRRPHAMLLRSAAQSINNSAWTTIAWDSEETDADGMHAASATTVSIPFDGFYLIEGAGNFVANATGARGARLRRNAAVIPGGAASTLASVAINTSVVTPTRRIYCTQGDTIDLQVWQSSGAALNVVGTAADSSFAASLSVTYDGS